MAEGSQIARQRVAAGESAHRHIDEALFIRFTRLRNLVSRMILRRPPDSRLRRAMIRRAHRLSIQAANRGDLEAMLMLWDPDCESTFPAQMATIGEPGTRGREERIRWEQDWRGEWGNVRYESEEIFDLGQRFLVLGRIAGSGAGSGAAVNTDWGLLVTVSPVGQVIREQVFFDRHEALEAAGLSE